jgi:hypothetical protein
MIERYGGPVISWQRNGLVTTGQWVRRHTALPGLVHGTGYA